MDRIKLILKDIPQFQIDDIHYIEGRIINEGSYYPEKVITSIPFKTTYDKTQTIQRLAQSRAYKRYSIVAYVDESVDLDLIEASDNINVEYNRNGDPEPWQIKLLSISEGELSATKNKKYEIDFYRLESDNVVKNDYLESNYLKERLDNGYISELVDIFITSTKFKTAEYLTMKNGILTFTYTKDMSLFLDAESVTVDYTTEYNENFTVTGQIIGINTKEVIIDTRLSALNLTGEFTFEKENANNKVAFHLYSALISEVERDSGNPTTISNEGSEYYINKLTYNQLKQVLYLKLEDVNLLEKYLNADIKIISNGSTYYHNRNMLATLSKDASGLIDLYKCDLLIKFAKVVI